ncbi:hypothetical protein Cgig2_010749 [Carnegiea gigantea]|uniref:protein-S-isoprenylcysteine alpha-carbonyl methylesterase n=1 Tax=Carnegiea gigantea TaxID=171969 RepID=A0A9Q1KJ72_9CARY|nr:hypothetical protein Cgig2_010749 [Carnegiea gigantea]
MAMKSEPPILPVTIPFLGSSTKILGMALQTSNDDLPTTRLLISPSIQDDNPIERRPLLSKSLSFSGGIPTSLEVQRRDQGTFRSSDDNVSPLSNGGMQSTFSSNVEHAAAETYLITRLSLTLIRYLGLQMDHKVSRPGLLCNSIDAWLHSRLDLYLPKNSDGPKPVVAFVTGGAWIIGYKAWGSLLGQQLSERDIMVACIDYRNFPQGTMTDMIEDASRGIAFVCNNIAEYGGDPNRVFLMGQSAGAHISACTLIEQAIKEAREADNLSWSVSQIKAYFGLSGGYNLLSLVDHFHNRGLYRSIFLSIMEGEESLRAYSPEIVVQDPNVRSALSLLPRIILFHGTADYSIPPDASASFAETLRRLGVNAEAVLYEGKTHTDVFLQDPMRGGTDQMFEDLAATIHDGDEEALAKDALAPPRRRLVPECMLRLATAVSPF